MTVVHTDAIAFHGDPLTLLGTRLGVGDRALDSRLLATDLSPVLPFESSTGKARLILTVPSLDTSVCALETATFDNELGAFGEAIFAGVISADLPFAQQRWREHSGVKNVTLLSDHRDLEFARNWGLLIRELRLLARAVYVVDRDSTVTYCEVVPELSDQPDYAAALTALRAASS